MAATSLTESEVETMNVAHHNPLTSPPTAAAIEVAIAKAWDRSNGDVPRTAEAGDRSDSLDELIGREGSYERGFLLGIALLAVTALTARVAVGWTAVLAVGVPLAVLFILLSHQSRRFRVDGQTDRVRAAQFVISGLLCAPMHLVNFQDVLTRAEKALLCTTWGAVVIGMIVCIAGI